MRVFFDPNVATLFLRGEFEDVVTELLYDSRKDGREKISVHLKIKLKTDVSVFLTSDALFK